MRHCHKRPPNDVRRGYCLLVDRGAEEPIQPTKNHSQQPTWLADELTFPWRTKGILPPCRPSVTRSDPVNQEIFSPLNSSARWRADVYFLSNAADVKWWRRPGRDRQSRMDGTENEYDSKASPSSHWFTTVLIERHVEVWELRRHTASTVIRKSISIHTR